MSLWTRERIIDELADPIANRLVIYRMLQAMYRRQTQDEQATGATRHNNGVGFSGVDSVFLSSVAVSSQRYGNLTERQSIKVAKCLRKYVGQLFDIATENLAQKAPLPRSVPSVDSGNLAEYELALAQA
jgi:hypothetical protein